jgi:hypothetical protein
MLPADHPNFRAALAAQTPPMNLAKAWTALVRMLRKERREAEEAGLEAALGGAHQRFRGRAEIDAVLDRPCRLETPAEALSAIKQDLIGVLREEPGAAGRVVDALSRWSIQVMEEPVSVLLSGLPRGAGLEFVRGVLGPEGRLQANQGTLSGCSPLHAAYLLHRWQGFAVGGSILEVDVALPNGTCLPALRREERVDRGRWGRGESWLSAPAGDARQSLSPEHIARRQAARVLDRLGRGGRVLDAFCGVGGNAVAFAEAGLRVRAVEADPHRVSVAQSTVRARGLDENLSIRCGNAEVLVPRLLEGDREDVCLFLDPPWENETGERSIDLRSLFGPFPKVLAALRSHPLVLLKLPRTFDLETLEGPGWRCWYEFGEEESGDAETVRMITAGRGFPDPDEEGASAGLRSKR